jgi:DNA-binding MarR family transcriptional regulator
VIVAHSKKNRLDPDVLKVMLIYRGLQREGDRALKRCWNDLGLSERALYILWLVSFGLDRSAKLAEYFDVLPSTITFDTDKLVAAGLITRQALPSDRRVLQLKLTSEGDAVYRRIGDVVNALWLPRLGRLEPGELATFLAVGHKLIEPDSQQTDSAPAETEPSSSAGPQKAARRRLAVSPAP